MIFLNCSGKSGIVKKNIEDDVKKGIKYNNQIPAASDLSTEAFLGIYKLIQVGFTGFINFSFDHGVFSGTIKFNDWGTSLPEKLKDISIKGNKIYFVRSITTKQEQSKYGSKRFFRHKYYGEFTDGGSKIRGYFVTSGAERKWEAEK